MTDQEFHPMHHVTKHMTGGRYHLIRERTRVNSWEEQDYLNFKEYLAMTLGFEQTTPFVLKMITDSAKYKKAYKSYAFGLINKIARKWFILVIVGVAAIIFLLYLTGHLSFGV